MTSFSQVKRQTIELTSRVMKVHLCVIIYIASLLKSQKHTAINSTSKSSGVLLVGERETSQQTADCYIKLFCALGFPDVSLNIIDTAYQSDAVHRCSQQTECYRLLICKYFGKGESYGCQERCEQPCSKLFSTMPLCQRRCQPHQSVLSSSKN